MSRKMAVNKPLHFEEGHMANIAQKRVKLHWRLEFRAFEQLGRVTYLVVNVKIRISNTPKNTGFSIEVQKITYILLVEVCTNGKNRYESIRKSVKSCNKPPLRLCAIHAYYYA